MPEPVTPEWRPAAQRRRRTAQRRLSATDQAIYFSRSPIPYRREADFAGNAAYYLHLGIYAYRRDFLLKFAGWPQTPLETTEKLEQLLAQALQA